MKKEVITEKNKMIATYSVILLGCFAFFLFSGKKAVLVKNNQLEVSNADVNIILDVYSDEVTVNGFEVNLPDVMYSKEELDDLSQSCLLKLKGVLLNDNESFLNINSDLYTPNSIDGYPFEIVYASMDDELITNEGYILCEEQFDSELTIIMSYDSFSRNFSIPIHVEPDRETQLRVKKEKLVNILESTLSSENAMIKTNDYYLINLPGDVNGKPVKYYYPGESKNVLFLLAGPVICFLLFLGKKKDDESEKKKMSMEVLDEYPKMIQKMSLYLSSGMTIRNIWLLLCDEADLCNKGNHPLYKEMRISVNELKSGILENAVYKAFGERLRIPEIVRFSALLSQNIKKGSTRLSEQLSEESKTAFENKKQRAIKRGEEAGTKLLLPMMLLLMDVMIMIILPAFWNI